MIHPTLGDYSNFPKVTFFYSRDEILYGALPNFQKALEQEGIPYSVYSKPDMLHCWPLLTFLPEGRAAFRQVASVLKQ